MASTLQITPSVLEFKDVQPGQALTATVLVKVSEVASYLPSAMLQASGTVAM